MFGSPKKCATKDDCPDNVCYDEKYCVSIDPATGNGVCYYGRCKMNDVCDQAYPQCSTQFVPTLPVPLSSIPTATASASVTTSTEPPTISSYVAPEEPQSKGLGLGAILGIVFGGILLIVIIIGGIMWWRNKKKDSQNQFVPIENSGPIGYKSELKPSYLERIQRPVSVSPRSIKPMESPKGLLASFQRQADQQKQIRYQ